MTRGQQIEGSVDSIHRPLHRSSRTGSPVRDRCLRNKSSTSPNAIGKHHNDENFCDSPASSTRNRYCQAAAKRLEEDSGGNSPWWKCGLRDCRKPRYLEATRVPRNPGNLGREMENLYSPPTTLWWLGSLHTLNSVETRWWRGWMLVGKKSNPPGIASPTVDGSADSGRFSTTQGLPPPGGFWRPA